MIMKITTSVKGLDKLKQRIQSVRKAAKGELAKKATGRGSAVLRDEAKKIVYTAPDDYVVYNSDGKGGKTRTVVKPGHVGRSIIMKRIPASERPGLTSKHIVTVSNSLEIPKGARQIATFVEYGINMPQPHPFMSTAYYNKGSEARKEAFKVLLKGVNEAWKKGSA